MNVNPWQAEGVSILPSDIQDLMPIVGQAELLRKLKTFRAETLSKGKESLSGFVVLIGGWGVGKSRVGHEICLEAVLPEAEWIVDGKPDRVLEAGLADGILPLFIRYSQVTTGPLGQNLSTDNWIPTVAREALSRLAGMRQAKDEANRFSKNQARLLDLTRKALSPKGKGWAAAEPALRAALDTPDTAEAVRLASHVMHDYLGIRNYWFVVDEIEDITDTERDGLRSEDRAKGIDQALLTVIPRVVKQEEPRQEFPQFNFILMCSLAVGDLMKGIPAIQRRTTWHELPTNGFQDVEGFFRYLVGHRAAIAASISSYPPGLKEAAFFAANRNFGWFNVIMHHAHENHRGGALDVPDLLKKFAEDHPRGHKGNVFQLEALSEYHIPHDADYALIESFVFRLLPQPVGTGNGQIRPEVASRLYGKKDIPLDKPIFTRVLEVEPPAPHLITAHLIGYGFQNAEGNTLVLPGEAKFDIGQVMSDLRAYSLGLPEERRNRLLICEKEEEFTEQVRSLSPFASAAEHFARPLHGLLMLAYQRAKDAGQCGPDYIAPSFSFLRGLMRLNRLREAESGHLRDARVNTMLEEEYEKIAKDGLKSGQALLRGIAYAWEKDPTEHALTQIAFPVGGHHLRATFSSQQGPLDLGTDSTVSLMLLQRLEESKLKDDLDRLAGDPRHPIVMAVVNNEDLAEQLASRIPRLAPGIAPFVIVHRLGQHQAEVFQRLGLMGRAFPENALRTRYFSGLIETGRQNLQQQAEAWRQDLANKGLILRPIFHGRSSTKQEEMRILGLGYRAMLEGISYNQVLQSSLFTEAEKDLFAKLVKRHIDPGPKFQGWPTLGLFMEVSGEISVSIPRALISVAERCSATAIPRAILETYFLYETHVDTQPRDVVQQITLFLSSLGILEVQGDKYSRVTTKALEDSLKRADEWLRRDFEQAVQEIEVIHRDAAEALRDQHAKVARQRLKDAQKLLDSVDLKFLKEGWDELNRITSDGQPLFVSRWKTAVQVVAAARNAVATVFEAEPNKAFVYTPDLLQQFEVDSARDDYPLWKRVAILRGFYRDFRDKRQSLDKRMQEIRSNVESRVPEIRGQRIFPIQPLTVPLDLYKAELHFPSDRPNRTIQAGGTTLGVVTVGFKLAQLPAKYREALERVRQIESDLTDPGKLASIFDAALKDWESLRMQARSLEGRIAEADRFFSDADAGTRVRFRLGDAERLMAELRGITEEGDIRLKTDSREEAGMPVFELASKLAGDIQETHPIAAELRSLLDGIEASVIVRLREDFHERYSALFSAFRRVREAQGMPPVALPERKAETWGSTKKLFEDVACQAEREGHAYLPDSGATSFRDLVDLCETADRLEKENQFIDWNEARFKQHVPVLVDKKLLQLRLI